MKHNKCTKIINFIALVVGLGTLSITVPMGEVLAENKPQPAFSVAQRRQEDVEQRADREMDALADRIFYERHPELAGSKIRPYETDFIQEWKAIRRCEAIVDYIFYKRHPELGGRKIQRHETELIREWNQIKSNVDTCY